MKHFLYLLFALSAVLVSCNPDEDDNELPGCIDSDAVNFNPDATIDDGSCIYGPCEGEDVLTYDSYTYDLVVIGEQCWFAENLRTEYYANGDAIPSNLSDSEWGSTTSGAVAVYGEDEGCDNYSPDGDACDPAWSLNEYGRHYNWYAVDDERGLCPTGWHVPTDEEWTVMTDFLGGELVAGAEMKTTYGWSDSGNGTNSSGFSGLPGGSRSTNGYFYNAGVFGFWWSSSSNGSLARNRTLLNESEIVFSDYLIQRSGFSVRCLRDSE